MNWIFQNTLKIKCKKFYRILKVNNSYHGPSGNPDNDLMKIQGIKDKTNQSNESYGLFRNAINDLLRQAKQNYKLASKKKMNSFKLKLNKFYDINTNRFGCYVNVKEKIYFTLKKISEYMVKNGQSIKDNVFNIHLSGDGCTITRTLKNFVNFTFKVLNENDNSTSGLYTLGNLIFFLKHFGIYNIWYFTFHTSVISLKNHNKILLLKTFKSWIPELSHVILNVKERSGLFKIVPNIFSFYERSYEQ